MSLNKVDWEEVAWAVGIALIVIALIIKSGWTDWQENELIKHCIDAGKTWTGHQCE